MTRKALDHPLQGMERSRTSTGLLEALEAMWGSEPPENISKQKSDPGRSSSDGRFPPLTGSSAFDLQTVVWLLRWVENLQTVVVNKSFIELA